LFSITCAFLPHPVSLLLADSYEKRMSARPL
jgi:hypothetical protein